MTGPFRVFIGLVPTGYLNPEIISQTIAKGIVFCGLSRSFEQLSDLPSPRLVLVPDVVFADSKAAQYTYTDPEVVRATLTQIFRFLPRSRVSILSKACTGFSSERFLLKANGNSEAFKTNGYYEFEKFFPNKVEIVPVEKDEHALYQLSKGEIFTRRSTALGLEDPLPEQRVLNEIFTSNRFASADYTIYCPKIKTNVLSGGFSGAIALGGQFLNPYQISHFENAICDMLEVGCPQFIVSDSIVTPLGGSRFTSRGQELGAILIANNALAHDWIAAQIIGINPLQIPHLQIAIKRGWGPSNLHQIELGGAGSDGLNNLKGKIEAIGRKTLFSFKELSEFYERENSERKFPLEILSSHPLNLAGAQGSLLDWLLMHFDFASAREKISKWPKITVCVGQVSSYPTHQLVLSIGQETWKSLHSMVSTVRFSIKAPQPIHRWFGGPSRFQWVQLKNGKNHLLVLVPSHKPQDLTLGFFLVSFGRIGAHLIRTFWRNQFQKRRPSFQKKQSNFILSSRLKHNSWWALGSPKISRLADLKHPE